MSDTTAYLVYGFTLTEVEYKRLFETSDDAEQMRRTKEHMDVIHRSKCELAFHGDATIGKVSVMIVACNCTYSAEATEAPRPVDVAIRVNDEETMSMAYTRLETVARMLPLEQRRPQWHVIVNVT